MPGTLSTVTRVTARSISRKTYQATALATAVKPARNKKARKSLTLMPNRKLRCVSASVPVCVWRDRVVLVLIESVRAASVVILSTRTWLGHGTASPRLLPFGVGAVQPIHRLKAPVRLNHGEIDIIHSLVLARSVGQCNAIQVEDAKIPDCCEKFGARHAAAQVIQRF